jgi:hypothetical protein
MTHRMFRDTWIVWIVTCLSPSRDIPCSVHYSQEEGLLTQATARRLIDPWSVPSFSPITANEIMGKSQASVDHRLLALSGSYLRHTIGTFNTYSWGPTHRSLTDTNGGLQSWRCRLFISHSPPPTFQHMVLRFPPNGPTWSQVIQSQPKPQVKVMWDLSPIRGLLTTRHLLKPIYTPRND